MSFDIFDDDFDFGDAMDLAGAIGIAQEECEDEMRLKALLGYDDDEDIDY